MALSPLSSAGPVNVLEIQNRSSRPLSSQSGNDNVTPLDSETSIRSSIDRARRGSVLYQVVSKLLLSEEETARLDQSNEISAEMTSTRSDVSSTASESSQTPQSLNFTLTIEQGSLTTEAQINGVQVTSRIDWLRISLEQSSENQEEADPLVIDLNGDGISFSGPSSGMEFDIDNDGQLELVSTVTGDDVFLALDRNNNGRIDNAGELFGDQAGYRNGFEALKAFDDNMDNKINSEDQVFNRLLTARLLGNQQFLTSLKDQGIQSINLDYDDVSASSGSGNRIVQLSDYRTDNDRGTIADVMLTYRELDKSQSE